LFADAAPPATAQPAQVLPAVVVTGRQDSLLGVGDRQRGQAVPSWRWTQTRMKCLVFVLGIGWVRPDPVFFLRINKPLHY
jgi:hypothetical protein